MMKRKIFTFLLVLGVAWSLHSCDNNDDESIAVPVELQSTFSAKYPNATNVEWENKYGYYVADFYDGHEASAWFTQEGKWVLTSWEVHFNTLPDPVKIRFMLHILDELMTTTLNMLKKQRVLHTT